MELTANRVSKFFGHRSRIRAVEDASITVRPGDFIAIVGESGSGKSTLARMLVGLTPPSEGTVELGGRNLAEMDKAELRKFRSTVQFVLQDPAGSLNPRKTIRRTLTEVAHLYGLGRGKALDRIAIDALEQVGISGAEAYLDRYPHELSGGQRQRVLIARVLIPKPRIIVADEAVSALDVSVKAGVLKLMDDLRRDLGIGYVLISHDLSVVRKVASYTYVMTKGRVVEEGETEALFVSPEELYTRTLLDAVLDFDTVLTERFGPQQGYDHG